MKTCLTCKHYEPADQYAAKCNAIKGHTDYEPEPSDTSVRWCGCCDATFSPAPDFGCILHEDK